MPSFSDKAPFGLMPPGWTGRVPCRPEGFMRLLRLSRLAVFLALAAGGCAGGGGLTSASLPELPKIELPALSGTEAITASPTEVYTAVARGALTCWFGAAGPLKGSYIYHAEADPPSKGGRSEIVVRTRDNNVPDPRSLRAFRIGIAPAEGSTHVVVDNFTIPEPLASRLKADTSRWARGSEGCGEEPMTAGWSAAPAEGKAKKAAGKATKP
jgi:hypothetical protein